MVFITPTNLRNNTKDTKKLLIPLNYEMNRKTVIAGIAVAFIALYSERRRVLNARQSHLRDCRVGVPPRNDNSMYFMIQNNSLTPNS